MQSILLLSFLSLLFGVYGDSRVLFKRGNDVSSLYERQSTCNAGYFLCPSGTVCCEVGTTCTSGGLCDAGLTTCAGSGEQVCGINCCESPLVCSSSTLQCVQGSGHKSKRLLEFDTNFTYRKWFQAFRVSRLRPRVHSHRICAICLAQGIVHFSHSN